MKPVQAAFAALAQTRRMENDMTAMETFEPLKTPYRLRYVSDEKLKQLQDATLSILERTGVKFPSEAALKVLAEHGALVDLSTQVVRFPREVVFSAMKTVPKRFQVGGRTSLLRFPPGRRLHVLHHGRLRRGDDRPGDPRATPIPQRGCWNDGPAGGLPARDRVLLADGELARAPQNRAAARSGCRAAQHAQTHSERDDHGRRGRALCT